MRSCTATAAFRFLVDRVVVVAVWVDEAGKDNAQIQNGLHLPLGDTARSCTQGFFLQDPAHREVSAVQRQDEVSMEQLISHMGDAGHVLHSLGIRLLGSFETTSWKLRGLGPV